MSDGESDRAIADGRVVAYRKVFDREPHLAPSRGPVGVLRSTFAEEKKPAATFSRRQDSVATCLFI